MQAQDVLAITVWWWVVMLREMMTSIHFFKSWFYSIFKKSKTSSALAGSLWFQDQNEPLLLSPSQPSQPGWCLVVSNLLIGYAGWLVMSNHKARSSVLLAIPLELWWPPCTSNFNL